MQCHLSRIIVPWVVIPYDIEAVSGAGIWSSDFVVTFIAHLQRV